MKELSKNSFVVKGTKLDKWDKKISVLFIPECISFYEGKEGEYFFATGKNYKEKIVTVDSRIDNVRLYLGDEGS